jgi:hypothetical protein
MGDHRIEYFLGWFVVILCALAFGVMVALGASCGSAQLTTSDATTALKLAVCVEQAVQEESAQRQAHVQQVQKEQFNDATKSDAGNPYRVPSAVGHEVDEMMRVRDAGVM